MKKVLLFVLLISVCTDAIAQEKFSFGIKAGANVSTASHSSDFIDYDNNIGALIGLFSEYQYSEKIFFRGGLELSEMGYSEELIFVDSDNASIVNIYSTDLDYIQIPLTAYYKYSFLRLGTGLQGGYLFSARQENHYSGEIIDIKNLLDPVDFGFTINANLLLGSKLSLEIGYYHAFVNSLKYSGEFSQKNSALQLAVTYKVL